MQLLRESNRDKFTEIIPININKSSKKCLCKQIDGSGLSPWLIDSEMISIKQCRSTHSSSLDGNKDKMGVKSTSRTRDMRKLTKSNSIKGIVDTGLKFYHFDDICEYMTHYRENITLPVLMQYRTRLSRTVCGVSCYQNDVFVKDCNCSKKSAVADYGWLSVAYVKQIESTLINRCYCDSPGVSVQAIIEQVKQRPTPCDVNKPKKSPRKEYYSRSEGKLKRQPVSPPKCIRQTVVLGKKGSTASQVSE